MTASVKHLVLARLDDIRRWIDEKRTAPWMADQLRISRTGLYRNLPEPERSRVSRNGRRYPQKPRQVSLDVERVRELAREGHRMPVIADTLGLTYCTLRYRIRTFAPELLSKIRGAKRGGKRR